METLARVGGTKGAQGGRSGTERPGTERPGVRPQESAWAGLEELREPLRSCLSRRCQDANEVEDLIQETFLRAARYRSGRRRVRCLRSWTLRIALNVLSDARRRGAGQALPVDPELLEVPVEDADPPADGYRLGSWCLDAEAARVLLARTLAEAEERDRAILDSFYLAPGGARCAAERCGIPQRLVKIRLFRARRRLRRALRRQVARGERWGALAS